MKIRPDIKYTSWKDYQVQHVILPSASAPPARLLETERRQTKRYIGYLSSLIRLGPVREVGEVKKCLSLSFNGGLQVTLLDAAQ